MIREMTFDDLPACAEILCLVYNNDLWRSRWERSTAEQYLTDLFHAPHFLGCVLEEEGRTVAGLFAREKVWWSGNEIYVEELFVLPQYQGRGFGARLMEQVERHVKEKGLAGITLSTNRYVPARQFYRKLGFTECEHVLFLCRQTHREP